MWTCVTVYHTEYSLPWLTNQHGCYPTTDKMYCKTIIQAAKVVMVKIIILKASFDSILPFIYAQLIKEVRYRNDTTRNTNVILLTKSTCIINVCIKDRIRALSTTLSSSPVTTL